MAAIVILPAAAAERGALALDQGGPVTTWRLDGEALSATFAPALGGKLISLQLADGTELLSRSDRPYRPRSAGAAYGETEFDGMDECFPAVAPGPYPLDPWRDREVADHGDLCQQAWEVIDLDGGLTLQARGQFFPYRFTRRAELSGATLHLRYRVENLGTDPFACSYANHPLFAAATGCGLELPDDVPITLALSRAKALGERGASATWAEFTRPDGRLLATSQFASDSGEYYKYIAGPMTDGAATFRHAAGHRVHLRWDASVLPYLAVWVSQGAVGGLHHFGAEVAMSRHDALDQAHAAGEAAVIPPGGELTWTISMRVEAAGRGLPATDSDAIISGGEVEP